MKKLILMGLCVIVIAAGIIFYVDMADNDKTIPSDIFFPSADSSDSDTKSESDTQDLLMTESATVDESSGTGYEELSYKDAEILKLVKLTTPVEGGDKVTLSISGMPVTRYDVYLYYSKSPSNDEDLSPKYSDGEGNATWEFTVPSGIAEGRRKIAIVGGGEILYVYLDIE